MIVNGEVIKIRRTRLGLSQREVSDGICNQSLISRLETSNHITSMTLLKSICQRLQLNPDDVMLSKQEVCAPLFRVRQLLMKRDWRAIRDILREQNSRTIPAHSQAEFHLLRARLLIHEKKYKDAVMDLRKAMLSNKLPDIIALEIYAEYVHVALLNDNHETAREMQKVVLERRKRIPKRVYTTLADVIPQVCYYVAQVYLTDDNYAQALFEIELGIELIHVKDDYALFVELQLLRAKCASELNRIEKHQDAVVMAYTAAEFSQKTELKETVYPYWVQFKERTRQD